MKGLKRIDEQNEEAVSRVSIIDEDSGPTLRIDKKDMKYLKVELFQDTAIGFILGMVAGIILFIILNQTIGSKNNLTLLIPAVVIVLWTVYAFIRFLMTNNEAKPYYVCLKGIMYKAWREGVKKTNIAKGSIKGIHLQFYKGFKDSSTRKMHLKIGKKGRIIYKKTGLTRRKLRSLLIISEVAGVV